GGPALLNYRTAPRFTDTGSAFAGNPGTVMLKAYAGDPVKVHALGAPGDEQHHVFSLGGQTWRYDDEITKSMEIESLAFGPQENVDADIIGGGGGGGPPGRGVFFCAPPPPLPPAGAGGGVGGRFGPPPPRPAPAGATAHSRQP